MIPVALDPLGLGIVEKSRSGRGGVDDNDDESHEDLALDAVGATASFLISLAAIRAAA